MSLNNASRRQFLRTASVVSGSVGTAAAPFALNLATPRLGRRADAPGLQGDRLPVPVRRQRLVEHGAAHRHGLVRRVHRMRTPAPTRSRCWRRARRRTTARRRARRRASAACCRSRRSSRRPCSARPRTAPATFGLHPSMPEVASLFGAGRLAILAQRRAAGRADDQGAVHANSVPRPRALGSHNDQQSTWQALGPEGVKVGWGGHLGDLVASANTNAELHQHLGRRATRCSRPATRCSSTRSAATARWQIGGITGNLFNSSSARRR